MKRKLILATLFALLLTLVLGMAQADSAAQTYTYSGVAPKVGDTFTLKHESCGNPRAVCTVTKAPSCIYAGAGTGFCDECGASYANFAVTIKLASTAHSYGDWNYDTDIKHIRKCKYCTSTESEFHSWRATPSYGANTHTKNCEECGTVVEEQHNLSFWLSLDGENYNNYYGIHQRQCTVLGCGYTEQAKHEWSEWIIQPDYHHVHCTTEWCSAFYNDAHTLAITSHDISGHTYSCTMCGYEAKTEDHTWGAWTTTLIPTCTEDGVRVRYCTSGCGQSQSETIPAVGHMGGKSAYVKPTCTEVGYNVDLCIRCGTTVSAVEVPAAGHSWSGWSQTVAPTCAMEGKEVRKCTASGCGATEERAIARLQHSMTTKPHEAPTCAKMGSTMHYCTKCTYWYVTEDIAKLPHDFGNWLPEPGDPTMEYRACVNCGIHEYRYVRSTPTPAPTATPAPEVIITDDPKPTPVVITPVPTAEPVPTATPEPTAMPEPVFCDHKNMVEYFTPPTCTKPGFHGGRVCPDCGLTLLTGGIFPPLGHDWSADSTMTTEDGGYIIYHTCLRCGYMEYIYEGRIDDPENCTHENTVTLPGYPASCEEPGKSAHEFCTDCGVPVTLPHDIPATGHQNLIEIPAVPGKTAGLYCGDCGKILVQPQDVNENGDPLYGNVNGIVVTPAQDAQIGEVKNNVYTDNSGNVIGTFQPDGTLLAPDGSEIGRLEGDRIYDNAGTHLGTIVDSLEDAEDDDTYTYVDGIVIDPNTGKVIGEVENNVYTDNDGNVIGNFQPDGTLVDPNGQVIGDLDGDKIYDNAGNHVGTIVDGVDEDKYNSINGTVVTPDGETVLGKVENSEYTDVNGGDVGTFLPDGTLVDPNGNVIGKLEGDYIYDNDGNHVGTIVDYTKIPGSDDFDLGGYLDDYYTHVEDGEKIRPTIDEENCVIGSEQDVNGE